MRTPTFIRALGKRGFTADQIADIFETMTEFNLEIDAAAPRQPVVSQPAPPREPPVPPQGSPAALPQSRQRETILRVSKPSGPRLPGVRGTFEDFYERFPKKQARKIAQAAWDKATKTIAGDQIADRLDQYLGLAPADRVEMNPATFINSVVKLVTGQPDGEAVDQLPPPSGETQSKEPADDISIPENLLRKE